MSTDYILPAEICAMVNVALDAKNQALKLCAVEGVDIVSVTHFRLIQSSPRLIATKWIQSQSDHKNYYLVSLLYFKFQIICFYIPLISSNAEWAAILDNMWSHTSHATTKNKQNGLIAIINFYYN